MAEEAVSSTESENTEIENEQDISLDVDATVADIAADLGIGKKTEVNDDETDDLPTKIAAPSIDKTKAAPVVRAAPQSWAKEHHETWSKMPKVAQDYYEKREKEMLDGLEQYKNDSGFGKHMREVTMPYKAMLQAQGVDEPKAVQFLLNAHYRLTNSPMEERKQYFAHLARSYGVELPSVGGAEVPAIDPAIKAALDRLDKVESNLTSRDRAAHNEARTRTANDVEAFASDKAHPYFDEVADDIIAMIKSGADLKDAYEKAVWANPVTRVREMARIQTENDAKLRENARLDATKAKKAAGSNVRGRDTTRAPTEPTGKWEDSLEKKLAEIRARTH